MEKMVAAPRPRGDGEDCAHADLVALLEEAQRLAAELAREALREVRK